ncbi:MAG: universal stress protein [Acidovorax sp.]
MYQHILVPVDGSSTSNKGLDQAIALAKLTGGRLRLVHVIDELSLALSMGVYAGASAGWQGELRGDALKLLEAARARAVEQGVAADTVLLDTYQGKVHEQVLAEVDRSHSDLIVLGTHGRRGLNRWLLGSSAEQILRMAQIPVLLIRAPEEAQAESERFTLPTGTVASQ